MSRKTHRVSADLYRLPKCKYPHKKQEALRPLVFYTRNSAAGIAAAAVSTAGIIGCLAAAAAVAAKATATVDPDHHNGDDHDDPEGLIPTAEEAAAPAVVTAIASVHRRYLLYRFLTSSYSTGRNLCAPKLKKSRAAAAAQDKAFLYYSSFRR